MSDDRVTPQMFRDIIEQFGFMPGVDIEWQWLTVAADRIEALEALHRTDTELRRATQEANNRLAARNRRLVQALTEAGVSHYVDCPALTEGDDCTCDEWEAQA